MRSFTITAEYTATGSKNYKTSDPKVVTTAAPSIENQNIALKYGYTTEITVRAGLAESTTSEGIISSGVTIVITAEDGHEVGRGITEGDFATTGVLPGAVINVDHPGRVRVTASHDGYMNNSDSETVVDTRADSTTESTVGTGTLILYRNIP